MKIFLKIVFIFFLVNQTSQADTKYYQYNGNVPFIEMMLNMMTTMGMIDKLPPNFPAYGNYNNNPYSANRWQGVNPEARNRPAQALSNQLNGLWMTRQGEMLAINNQQFLWSDGRTRYLTGQIMARENKLSLKVKGNGLVMDYQYQFDNRRLQTRDSEGVVRGFVRVPMNQGR